MFTACWCVFLLDILILQKKIQNNQYANCCLMRIGLMPCDGLKFHTECVLALHPVFQAGMAGINGLTFKV